MAEAMGIATLRSRSASSCWPRCWPRVSGWLFAHFQRTVNPSPFGLKMGIEYLFMAVLGGVGHVWGAFVGAGVVKLLEDQLQVLLPRLIGTSGNFEIIVFGMLLVLVLKYAPDGLWTFVDALAAARRAARGDWARRRRRCRRAPSRPPASCCCEVEGGAQGVRRAGGRQRHQLRDPRRRDRRPDRPQRRRQVAPPST